LKVTAMDTLEWTELDRLTACLRGLVSRYEAAPKSRVGLLRQIESEIARVDGQRERVVTNLTRRVITQVAA
jgi:hypothetical protein